MTSLPTTAPWPQPLPETLTEWAGTECAGDEQFLLKAFRSFAAAARSLEGAYGQLRSEVERLRRELQESNAGLSRSLAENRRMREHLDRILEGLPCGVLLVNQDGAIARANPEARRLLAACTDAPASEAGRVTEEMIYPLHVAALPAGVQQLLERARDVDASRSAGSPEVAPPSPGCDPEQRFSDQPSGELWLAARHAAIADVQGRPAVFILRDVSERKRLETAETRMQRQQALGEMAAMLAHEIRNPLGSLELFAGLLAEKRRDARQLGGGCDGKDKDKAKDKDKGSDGDGEESAWIAHLQAGLRTLAATVNNVLHFHSLREIECTAVDLGALLAWSRDFFLPLASQSRIELSLHNGLSGVVVSGDRHRLEQVLQNLVLNAVRAMPGGGWIEISGRTLKPAVGPAAAQIAVADTGPGIAPQHLECLFAPGFTTRPGSPGLGLNVARKIVELHGGTIAASSAGGRGAQFVVNLPLGNARVETRSGGETE
jgi:signal transduction histidine kinase